MKELSKELLNKRNKIECVFIMDMYKNMALLDEYESVINGEDIITEDGIFYYEILKSMRKAGYNTADDISVSAYLEDKPVLKEGFERRGGYNELRQITGIMADDNVEAHYGEILKSNLLIRLSEKGFNISIPPDKLNKMTAEDIYDYVEYQLADISIGKIEKSKVVNLSEGYGKFINEWDQGRDVGYKIGLNMLNYQLLGIHKGHLMFHVGGIGQGKTTTAVSWYVLPAVEAGNNITILANEQGESEWRQMILSTIIFNKLEKKAKGLDRHKMQMGSFNSDQKERMFEAEEWLKKQPGKITFVELGDYNAAIVKRHIARQSKLGCSLFLFDTLKPTDEAADNAWALFSETAKSLFLTAKKYDVAIIATMQMSPEGMRRRYLDLTCIGKSKATAETASSVVMFRSINNAEKSKIKVYSFDGEDKKTKVMKDLDPNKEYIMVFVPKNRYGNTNPQIIVERNMNFNSYSQVGWYECPYDSF